MAANFSRVRASRRASTTSGVRRGFAAVALTAGIAGMAALGMAGMMNSASATPGTPHKTSICHRTASDTNPYVFETVDDASLQAHLSNGKGHPPTHWKSDGTWRGVHHNAGDPKNDYLASSPADCEDTMPTTPATTPPTTPATTPPTTPPTTPATTPPTTPATTPATTPPTCPTATDTVTTTVTATVTAQPAAPRAAVGCVATETVTVTDTVTVTPTGPTSAPTSAMTGTPTGGSPTIPTQTGGGNPESVFTPTASATESSSPQPGHVVPTRIESGLVTLPTSASTSQKTDRWPLFALSGLCALLGGIGLLPRRRTSRRS
ncbi:hypothetical protein GCM10028801_15380 [Nocardioides maradonensis]